MVSSGQLEFRLARDHAWPNHTETCSTLAGLTQGEVICQVNRDG